MDTLDFMRFLGCTAMPNMHGVTPLNPKAYASTPQGEIGYYTVVSGNKDLYLLHKSMRGAVFLPINHRCRRIIAKILSPL